MIKIVHRFCPSQVLFESTAETLREAVLEAVKNGASLVGADLVGANLGGANLVGADLVGADLADERNDLFEILKAAPKEVAGLLRELRAGKIDGSTYTGRCACLVGTIAKLRGVDHHDLGRGLAPNSARPAEQWFLHLKPGMTPRHSPVAEVTEGWIVAWMEANGQDPRQFVQVGTRTEWESADGQRTVAKPAGKSKRITIRRFAKADVQS